MTGNEQAGGGVRDGPAIYDQKTLERKWDQFWKEEKLYRFDFEDRERPVYSIDNPPRYASGALHAGHAVNYTQIDFAARYHRQRGENVFFPLCFDTNGTPIEVKVEKKHNITLDDVDRHEFIKLCRKFAASFISEMTHQFEALGCSMDPELYYQTDAEHYRRVTQVSFIKLFERGLIYKGTFPVNWCPRCCTAITEAEVEYQHRSTKLNYIRFKDGEGNDVPIATTRPELLCTCQLVAVNPEDEKLGHLVGKKLFTPLYNRPVDVVADNKVDPSFGTGIVMICSIGDKDDLEWIFRYKLNFEKGIDEKGMLTELAGKYQGMPISEGRQAVIDDLEKQGLLIKQDELDQNVGMCWRCSTPIEFLQVPQWFLKMLDFKQEILARADEIRWFPEYMKLRLREWVNSLAWDWAISRQRYFATPMPMWECEDCDHVILAKEEDCYVDPTLTASPQETCEKCGGKMNGCRDVFDTWMDSSISPLYNCFWQRDDERFKRLYPMSLRPQAQDIIRTWAYYTILREHLLVDEKPWNDIMIGAYILSPDGTPMHASKGNVVDPLELLDEYGSDSVRYWSAMCGLGEDSPVRFKDLRRGQKLATKLWNVERFIAGSIGEAPVKDDATLGLMDRWILTRWARTLQNVSGYFDEYAYDKAVKELEQFIWHELADHYIELVKHRVKAGDEGARYALYTVGLGVAKAIAPVMPHIAEDIYQQHFRAREGVKSVHVAPWPEPPTMDGDAERAGELAKDIVATVRSWKSAQGMALSAELGMLEVAKGDWTGMIEAAREDIVKTLKVREFGFVDPAELTEKAVALKPVHSKLGPTFKQKARVITQLLAEMEPEDGKAQLDAGAIKLDVDGEEVALGPEFVEVKTALVFHGKEVDSLKAGDVDLLVGK